MGVVETTYKNVTSPVVLALSTAWIGIGLVRPAKTNDDAIISIPSWAKKQKTESESVTVSTGEIDRYDYSKLWSLQIGEYFMPLSQTFSLRAKKRLNVSSLVDGVDIIQQTRKEAKTIDCVLRLTLRDNQPNLQIVQGGSSSSNQSQEGDEFLDGSTVNETTPNSTPGKVVELAQFLREFYDGDAVLQIRNKMINETFGVEYVFISEYKFTPKVGMGTFTFEFSLTEVKYGENVLTFNLREIDADAGNRRQIEG